MARREEYAKQANACREAATEATKAKNPEERDNQLGMAEKWEALGDNVWSTSSLSECLPKPANRIVKTSAATKRMRVWTLPDDTIAQARCATTAGLRA